MGYVPGFDSDVFVSYATTNNQELTEGKPGWVSSFRKILEKLLDEGLDRKNASKVWMDDNPRGNEPFDERLRDTVTKSAVLLVVMSDAYLASPWCVTELEIFLSATQKGTGRTGCIFLVHYEPVPLDRWPNGLKGLSDEKYRFFQQEREGALSKPLGYPTPNPDYHQSYFDRFLELRKELCAHLERMKIAALTLNVASLASPQKSTTVPDGSTFDVFLSHNSADKKLVRELGEALKKNDLTVWLDEWELIPGRSWQDALEEIVTKCRSAAVCVGDKGIGPWEEPEMKALLRRFIKEKKRGNVLPVIPLLLPNAPGPEAPTLPVFLEEFMWVDLRGGWTKEGLARLQWGITGEKPDSPRNSGQPDSGTVPAVYLAEVTGDTLYEQRRMVKSHLEQTQLRVLPAKAYRRTPAEYTQDLDSDLAQCSLFVQMLGRFPTGQEGLQCERALAAGKEILRWRSRDLKLNDVPDAAHHDLLSGIDVKEMDFDELKRTIVERTRMLSRKRPDRPEGDGLYILVNAYAGDPLADAIVTQLDDWKVGSERVGETPLKEVLTESQGHHAVMVVYGNCPERWVDDKMKQCREIQFSRGKKAPVFAVCLETPEKKKSLQIKPPNVKWINPQDAAQLQSFIQNLPPVEAPK